MVVFKREACGIGTKSHWEERKREAFSGVVGLCAFEF